MKKPETAAEQLYAQIKVQHPELWFEVISLLHLFAMRDQFGYTPMGLNPEMKKRLNRLQTDITLRRKP